MYIAQSLTVSHRYVQTRARTPTHTHTHLSEVSVGTEHLIVWIDNGHLNPRHDLGGCQAERGGERGDEEGMKRTG